MPTQTQTISEQEHRIIICICILAAFADGAQDEAERDRIQRIMNGFSEEHLDLASAYQDVLGGKLTLADAAAQLQSPPAKALAYEMAVCVCHADGVLKDSEKEFLANLAQALRLDAASTDMAAHQQTAQALAVQPLDASAPPVINQGRDAELDRLILDASILNGALELMPHTLATMAIVPLQMRMVYRIGNQYGYNLDRGHIKDFLATAGVGLTSQVVEGYAQRLLRGFTRGLAGGLIGGLMGEATGSAFAFATTYALGQAARRYYAGGRTMDAAQLKDVFSSLLGEARSMQGRYSGDIASKARQVNVASLLPLARQF